ncbi:MAG: PEP-utilizing enzyme, partial [Gemmatimonadota bacterium]|nr:PEP-utilizing enzyme [Gemmatimonadota bacterium]
MSVILDGTAASEGIASGKVFHLEWGIPIVPHVTIPEERAGAEIERFHAARSWAQKRLAELQVATEARLGPIEARIFEPQILMLDDSEVVDGTVRYISENHLSAERAFEWRMLELQAMWNRTSHPMVLDRLNDLEDMVIRVLHRLLGHHDPTDLAELEEGVIVVASNLTPSLTVHLDPDKVLGVATDKGTRTAHWAILARSLEIPAVVSLGDVTRRANEGQRAILDGRIGRVVLDPGPEDEKNFAVRQRQLTSWEADISTVASLESITKDGQYVELRANLDLPSEA